MKTAVVTIESMSPYSSSRRHETPRENEEEHDAYENRTWREKCTTDEEGFWVIPRAGFQQSLQTAAGQITQKVKGKGAKQWTAYFLAGVIVENDLRLPIKKQEVKGIRLPCSATGQRGRGSQVFRWFPIIEQWGGEVVYHILDDMITQEVFVNVLTRSLGLVGVGRFRGEKGGFNGRAKIVKIKWLKN